MNSLQECLHYLKLTDGFYCKSEFRGDFSLGLPSMPGTSMFHIVTEGRFYILCDDQELEVNAGDFVFLPKGEGHITCSNRNLQVKDLFDYHRVQVSDCYETLNYGEKGPLCRILCGVVRLDHPSAEYLLRAMPNVIHLKSSQISYGHWLHQTVQLISQEAEQNQVGGETVLTRLSDVLVIQALRFWIQVEPESQKGWLGALQDARIGRALSLIHSNPHCKWSLESLAREIGMSRTPFAARFTKLVGEPMFQYLTKWRIQLAVMWLREGKTINLEFVEKLGYQSESAFRRVFKKVMGVQPSQFRLDKKQMAY